jgi:hypothetical protein
LQEERAGDDIGGASVTCGGEKWRQNIFAIVDLGHYGHAEDTGRYSGSCQRSNGPQSRLRVRSSLLKASREARVERRDRDLSSHRVGSIQPCQEVEVAQDER